MPERTEVELAKLILFANEDGTFLEVRDAKGTKFQLRCDYPEATVDLDVNVDAGELMCAHLSSSNE